MSNLNLWEDLNKLKETCKWVDLSHEVSPETPHWFGFPSVKSSVLYDFEKDGFRAHTYEIVSQYGTHVDAPYHFSNTGETIDNMELDFFLGDAVVVHVTEKKADEAITMEDIEPYKNDITEGKVVLFNTNWYKKRGTELLFAFRGSGIPVAVK